MPSPAAVHHGEREREPQSHLFQLCTLLSQLDYLRTQCITTFGKLHCMWIFNQYIPSKKDTEQEELLPMTTHTFMQADETTRLYTCTMYVDLKVHTYIWREIESRGMPTDRQTTERKRDRHDNKAREAGKHKSRKTNTHRVDIELETETGRREMRTQTSLLCSSASISERLLISASFRRVDCSFCSLVSTSSSREAIHF